ncbi:hypothetical protein SY83_05225 [Paenibacillus swuensis]|uniref:Uncharacterized protein n=1 Tax=Paenibacillus swuensis TaxID=1178515 RepID=A0A172TFG7_9BACL|nr:hypothetical protein [Paenibacillus swuensis]ANE45798.1 hypothetical protein SY83_05225 [Paenibacillus swuensis]
MRKDCIAGFKPVDVETEVEAIVREDEVEPVQNTESENLQQDPRILALEADLKDHREMLKKN